MSMLSQLQELYAEIRQVYTRDHYPWVIGYSGGKDSTTALQMVWMALSELPTKERMKPVYVISTDTLVETPIIVDRNKENIELINRAAKQQELPIEAHNLSPILDDTFWVNLLGRGYPAPNSGFRWCTERLKINSNRFILNKVAEHGKPPVLAVAAARVQPAIRYFKCIASPEPPERHGQLPGAWVYMPIEEFSTDDVWTYLLQVPNPWGGDNRHSAALYRSAQDGECPLVVDSKTSSCGGSRFGCWVCTVVTKDKTMEAMIDSGEEDDSLA
ncbi:MAG: DNA phosphorothioation system sulfurtransferase DndC [Caldilineaceae bacterium]